MPAFCVYGISKSTCRAIAEKKVQTVGQGGRTLTISEWGGLRDQMAANLFDTLDRRVKVSPEFDAPQFCHDWLAVNPSHVKLPVIMVRGAKTDKNGEPVLRNGVPVMTWLEYESANVELA